MEMSVCDAYRTADTRASYLSEAIYMEVNNHASAIMNGEEGCGENNNYGKV